VLSEIGFQPEEVAYVGDRIDNDVRPARAAGMLAVHIRRGPWGYLQTGREEAHVRVDSLDELPGALEDV
jgi:FMN phosphatase YigB (HAD superfamily)